MAQVAQAYFHFHTVLPSRELRRFGRQIDKASRRAALRNFETTVLINVEIVEGSLIGRITAYAGIIGLVTTPIANYKGVKDSIKEMYSDARSFGSEVVDRAVDLAGVSEKQVYRVERRTKTVGRLARLLNDIERLESSVDNLTPKQMKQELGRINNELEAVAADLDPQEQKNLIGALEHTKLPPPAKWPRSEEHGTRAILRPEQYELTIEAPEEIDQRTKVRRRQIRYENSFKVEPQKSVVRRDAGLIPKL
ncbi:hypothetical protein MXD81_44675 [Microbacteriaceae bacterium K1510]|nr:hypothetical protein [Microbacteriaceae bacterium K1510]